MKKSLAFNPTKLHQQTWVQHLVFWIALFILFALFRALRAESLEFTGMHLILELIPLSGIAVAVYTNLKILLPRYLVQKRYVSYIFSLLAITFINAVIVFTAFEYLFPLIGHLNPGPHPKRWLFFPAFMTMQIIFTVITSFIHVIRENNRLNEIALSVTEIESNRLRVELNSLKAQINPHFLFNTLNNIYSYSLFKSEKTPDMILKLSNLMNYIIYECQADLVSLNKEMEFIRNYVDLEQLRVEDTVAIELDLPKDVMDYQVAPLLFIPLLENAFKHGANINDQEPYIKFYLDVNHEGLLHFRSENLIDDNQLEDLPERQGGIGLDNVRKRLELLYPNRYMLDIKEGEGKYLLDLQIDLADRGAR